jgi:hypothetical protein
MVDEMNIIITPPEHLSRYIFFVQFRKITPDRESIE